MNKNKILIVDDEEAQLTDIMEYFQGYDIRTISDPELALTILTEKFYDILVVDFRMPKLSGLDLLIEARKRNAYYYGILFTAYADKELLEKVVNKNLVNRILEKPLRLKELKMSIDQAISECEEKKLAAERLEFLKRSYDIFKEQERENHKIIGLEKGLKHIYQQVERIAPLSVNILISGKTGTGKEQLAHCIHQLSPRREKNLIKVNCSAIPDSLLESELFGYDKGAFTGADKNKFGKIELANGGTLFLDEIGELKLNLQVKLLRFLQEKEIERLGSNKTIKVDFRLICATNKNLEELVAQGLLREDFYYRVNSYPIHLPALNERFEDLKDLVEYFVYKTSLELGIRPPDIEHDVVEKLKQYTWPGNIRELENACRRALISCYNLGTIRANDFAFLFEKNRVDKFSFNHAINVIRDEIIYNNFDLKKIEKHILKSILDYYDNNVQQAVQKTGILKDKFYRGRKGTLVR